MNKKVVIYVCMYCSFMIMKSNCCCYFQKLFSSLISINYNLFFGLIHLNRGFVSKIGELFLENKKMVESGFDNFLSFSCSLLC